MIVRAAIAALTSIVMVTGAGPDSCAAAKKKRRSNLSHVTVVTAEFSATSPGFTWHIDIPANGGHRKWGKQEPTRDHTERFEVMLFNDVVVTMTASSGPGNVLSCSMRTSGGLVKRTGVAAGSVSCAQNVATIFDPYSYK
jgi:hypothetical protein